MAESQKRELDRVHPMGEGVAAGIAGLGRIDRAGYIRRQSAGAMGTRWRGERVWADDILHPAFEGRAGVFDSWVEDSPLRYASPNAPSKRDVLGTILLSVVAGHCRYAPMAAIRSD